MSPDELVRAAEENHRAGKLAQAEIDCSHAIALDPRHAGALHLLGLVGHQLDRADAIARIRRAVALRPDVPAFHNNLGVLLEARGQYAEAIQCYEHAVSLDPGYADAHHHLAMALLMRGDYARGWSEYEWRSKTPSFLATHPSHGKPAWTGDDLAGRVLLLHAEQGIGDAIQFLRYVPRFAKGERRPKLLVLCHRALYPLAARNFSECCVVTASVYPTDFDVEYALDRLPFFFRTTVETVPAKVPYLVPDPEKAARWQRRLAADSRRLKVGLVWAGNPAHPRDRQRSLPFSALLPLGEGLAGASFYSLQKGEAASQARDYPGFGLTDFTGELRDLDDTAALVANLDLVITVDTAVAHLAGAMGKPVWTMLTFVPDWRWLLEREDSPWYPTMRLFRQREIGGWAEVIGRIAETLGRW